MRNLSLLLPALMLFACQTGGVKLDDSGTPETDADTDADADTDTDTDADTDVPPGALWTGTVEVMIQSAGVPFCDGAVDLGIEDNNLTGGGDCVISGGPGAGQVFDVDFDGTVSGGSISGTMTPTMDNIPDQPTPVDMSGTVDDQQLSLDFEFELASPNDPGQMDVMVGSVQATPAD